MFRQWTLWILWSVLAIAGLILVLRAFFGPLPLKVNSPMNAESAFGLAVPLMLLARSTAEKEKAAMPRFSRGECLVFSAALIVITAAAFWRTIHFYLLSDDFILLKYANARPNLRPLFLTGGGDGFFRPVGYLSLTLNSLWASLDPASWHGSALALHIMNSVLLFALSLQLGFSRIAAFFAALLFAIHGSRAEAVAWIASHFDRVSAFFVLCGLILFIHSLAKSKIPGICRMLSLACMVLAILSKESAYTFPLLLVLAMGFSRERGRPGRKATILIPFFAVAAILFAGRWVLFGGIGGYLNARTGTPMASEVSLIPVLKVLFFRLWAVLFFPINWEVRPGLALSILLAAFILAICLICAGRVSRKQLLFPLGFVLVTALPPMYLLLIGSDLQGARLLYLPAVGFCLLLALAADSVPPQVRYVLPGVVIAFQLAALEHNLDRWEYASEKAKAACAAAVRWYGPAAGNIAVSGLPGSLDGVFFFANGFPECVEMQQRNDGLPEARNAPVGSRLFWDEAARDLRGTQP